MLDDEFGPGDLKRVIEQRFHLLYETDCMGEGCVQVECGFTFPSRVNVEEQRVARGAEGVDRYTAGFLAGRSDDFKESCLDGRLVTGAGVKRREYIDFHRAVSSDRREYGYNVTTTQGKAKVWAARCLIDSRTADPEDTDMRSLSDLFDNNRRWAAEMLRQDPDFFKRLSAQQAPEYLWIGCSDSRVPANQIVGMLPGEMFVHRNVGNVVVHTDLNCHSTIQYAVEVLKVKYIIVCGHYGCGGVRAALKCDKRGLIENWLQHVQDVRSKYQAELDALEDPALQLSRLCELNVIEQVMHVCQSSGVRDAWARGQELEVHGWIYDLRDGLLRDLGVCVTRPEQIPVFAQAAQAGSRSSERAAAGALHPNQET